MSSHINTRTKLNEIPETITFIDLIDRAFLSDTEKQLMMLHYVQDKDFCYIGDSLGYSEGWMKKLHAKCLKKLSKLL